MFKQMRWIVAAILHVNAIVVAANVLVRNVILLTGLIFTLYALYKLIRGM